MKGIKLLKPQPSPKSGRDPLANITNCFFSRPKSDKQPQRSPSHSPRSTNRSTFLDHERKKARLAAFQSKCVNHKERAARFKIQGEAQASHYCEHCALELSQKGKRVVLSRNELAGNRMVGEAREFLQACDQALATLVGKLTALNVQKGRVDAKSAKTKQELEDQRQEMIRKVNEQYDREFREQEETRRRVAAKLEQELAFFRSLQHQLQTIRQDVGLNLPQINNNVQSADFREIMDFYWNKIAKFNEAALRLSLQTVSESSQVFAAKYLPPEARLQSRTFEDAVRGPASQAAHGKEFTFSKNLWGLQSRARETLSWQNSNPGTESGESVVEEKYSVQ